MIKYIELKTGHSDNGPAWIARHGFAHCRVAGRVVRGWKRYVTPAT
jgi:hypothetical protein